MIVKREHSKDFNWPDLDIGPHNSDLLLEYDSDVFDSPPNLFDIDKYEAVIFDLDGTLWTDHYWEALKKIAKRPELNFPSSIESFKKRAIQEKGFYLPHHLFNAAGLDYYDFLRNYSQGLVLHTDARPTLEALNVNGCKIGFLTSDSRKAVDYKLSKTGLVPFVKKNNIPVLTPGNWRIRCNNPNPKGVEELASQFDVPVEKVLMVGDNLSDIGAAQRAGADSFLIHRTPWPGKDFGEMTPTFYTNKLQIVYTIACNPLKNYTAEQRAADKELLKQRAWYVLRDFPSGQMFFNTMDKEIKTRAEFARLALYESNRLLDSPKYIVLSGEISRRIWRYTSLESHQQIITVPGGLRHGKEIPNYGFILNGEDVDFVDDSFYAGRTRNLIRDWVKECGGDFVGTLATYCGSQTASPDTYNLEDKVHLLFRYWDYHYPDENGIAVPKKNHPMFNGTYGWKKRDITIDAFFDSIS